MNWLFPCVRVWGSGSNVQKTLAFSLELCWEAEGRGSGLEEAGWGVCEELCRVPRDPCPSSGSTQGSLDDGERDVGGSPLTSFVPWSCFAGLRGRHPKCSRIAKQWHRGPLLPPTSPSPSGRALSLYAELRDTGKSCPVFGGSQNKEFWFLSICHKPPVRLFVCRETMN